MSNIEPHSAIIKKLCKEILIPAGIFQKGSSRVYIDDNGYFFTVIEFQPSGFSKGTFLNVGLCFLWNENDYMGWNNPNSRVGRQFIEYQDNEQFERDVKPYVEKALELALFNRNLRDIEYAKEYFGKRDFGNSPITYDIKIIKERFRDAEICDKIRRQRAFWHVKPSMKKMQYNEIYDKQPDLLE